MLQWTRHYNTFFKPITTQQHDKGMNFWSIIEDTSILAHRESDIGHRYISFDIAKKS